MLSLRILALFLSFLSPLVSAQARCQYYPLRNFADLFIEAQTFGELDPSFTISPSNFTFLQNGKLTMPSASTLVTPLEIDLEITLIDQTNCAIYTEWIIADPKNPHVIGAQIHFGFRDSEAVGLEVNRIELLKASTSLGTWSFNASATLGYARGETWEATAQTERTPREGLLGAADSFLRWLAEEGNSTEAVPFRTPCSRLEGGQYDAEACGGFKAAGKGVLAAEKRYVVDEVSGGVSVMFEPEGSGTVESYMLRVEGGKLRNAVHYIAEGQPEDGGVEEYNSLAAALLGVLPALRSLQISLVGVPIDHGKPEDVDLIEVLL
ncbi:hypothetical protein B0T14DRAFT_565072 [Immersiella caudata]|uniref:DUF8021 domain-containing protein n=1 Tax=Immersiella caudata TaxID=314043 RepID=A0AA39WY39_9PEZI|nr:hypothetical protein B0T14DRAFT_565072 [Immersiella caudata]